MSQQRNPIRWRIKDEFPDSASALSFVAGRWFKLVTNHSQSRRTDIYYCVDYGKPCAARAKLVYPKDKEDVVYHYESADKQSETEKCENGLSNCQTTTGILWITEFSMADSCVSFLGFITFAWSAHVFYDNKALRAIVAAKKWTLKSLACPLMGDLFIDFQILAVQTRLTPKLAPEAIFLRIVLNSSD